MLDATKKTKQYGTSYACIYFLKMQYRTPSGPSRKEGKFLILGGSRWFSVDLGGSWGFKVDLNGSRWFSVDLIGHPLTPLPAITPLLFLLKNYYFDPPQSFMQAYFELNT